MVAQAPGAQCRGGKVDLAECSQETAMFDLGPGLVTQKTFKIPCAVVTTDGSEHMYK